ncbi:hypothetical protein V490_04186 [Pseudogymnoascus sp. VKM F-3557]|nr:hypothetical protein V490_04186 [Pseudogymnoascus sp. VKM F-3557]
MTRSTEKDNRPPSVIASLARKQSPQSSSPSVTIPSKRERRNAAAKDNNGGGATAINIASKQLDDNKPATPSPPSFTPPASDVKPITTATDRNGPGITSPLLNALPSPNFAQTAGQSTTEWARNIPSFSSSPNNLINPSDTPPTVPSSYDDKNTLAGWNQRERKDPNGYNPSVSPPSRRQRPQSVQIDGYSPFDDNMSQRAPSTYRRNSAYSQQAQRFAHPPLPHQVQPHFYGAPDINLGLPVRRMGLKPGSQGYFFGLDSINTSRTGSKHTESVVISGFEGGLSVHAISKSGNTEISTLDGLRGGVYSAKILPWTVKGELSGGFPLIAAVVHGPAFYENDSEQGSPKLGVAETATEQTSGSIGNSSRAHHRQGGSTKHYQTTVEVWSLSTKRYVGTLLSLPETTLPIPITSPHFVPPAPVGALAVTADAGNIVVSSGVTGELWVFRQIKIDNDSSMSFRCLGKFWTTVQQPAPYELSAQPDLGDGDSQFNEAKLNKLRPKPALLSLRGRWLAYSPSSAMNQVSLRARVDISRSSARIPGLNNFAPPQPPTVNCAADTPHGEEFWGRIRRQAAQEAIKGAKWVGDQGSRVWANYWNKPNNVNGNWQSSAQKEPAPDFPPTHGAALQYDASHPDPVLITIVDLDKLATLRNATSATLATFKVPLGCSYMSFSPTGLALFTASNKGDVQFIWDLMRVQHTKSSALQPQAPGATQGIHVRQIASFTRLTVARIVDVIWTLPLGETIAMVTERNTVHFLDVPHNAFIWPPLRHRAKPSSSAYPSSLREATPSAAAVASNVANAAWNFTQPFLARPRGASGSSGPLPNRSSAITASLTAIAGQGGKAIASGISKSFGAATGTIQQFRRAGENKLHLPQTATNCSVGCVKWLGGHSNKEVFAALVDGHVKMYTIKHIRSKSKPGVYRIHIGTAPVDIRIPSIPDNKIAPLIKRKLDLADEEDFEERDAGENRTLLTRPTSLVQGGVSLGTESSIPHAEIESNAPYQPFHTDPRVALFAYSEVSHQLLSPTSSALFSPQPAVEKANRPSTEPWVFGLPIHAANLHIGKEHPDEDALMSSEYHRALPAESMERVTTRIPDDLSEPIVSTTRRRKVSRTTADVPDDEEGFFEDDCTVIDFASNRV